MTDQAAASSPAHPARRPRNVRRDAVRNYHRVLDAAHEVLAETGPGATMEQIAARAGVGVGTVYRRFPSKDHLIDELLHQSREQMLDTADQALRESDDHGLDHLLHALGPRLAAQSRYAGLLLTHAPDPAASSQLRSVITELVRRAIRAGTLDPGVSADDIMALIRGMRVAAISDPDSPAPGSWERFLGIHLAGMRTTCRTDTPTRSAASAVAVPHARADI